MTHQFSDLHFQVASFNGQHESIRVFLKIDTTCKWMQIWSHLCFTPICPEHSVVVLQFFMRLSLSCLPILFCRQRQGCDRVSRLPHHPRVRGSAFCRLQDFHSKACKFSVSFAQLSRMALILFLILPPASPPLTSMFYFFGLWSLTVHD